MTWTWPPAVTAYCTWKPVALNGNRRAANREKQLEQHFHLALQLLLRDWRAGELTVLTIALLVAVTATDRRRIPD